MLGLLTILLGCGFAAVGYWITKRSERFYAAMQRLLGTGAFPASGAKADRFRGFIHGYGRLVTVVGMVIAGLGVLQAIMGVVGMLG